MAQAHKGTHYGHLTARYAAKRQKDKAEKLKQQSTLTVCVPEYVGVLAGVCGVCAIFCANMGNIKAEDPSKGNQYATSVSAARTTHTAHKSKQPAECG